MGARALECEHRQLDPGTASLIFLSASSTVKVFGFCTAFQSVFMLTTVQPIGRTRRTVVVSLVILYGLIAANRGQHDRRCRARGELDLGPMSRRSGARRMSRKVNVS